VPEQVPVAFVRGGHGWIGEGGITRGEFAGPAALAEAAGWWSRFLAERPDPAPAHPRVAFGSFPFDPRSPEGGVLLVPERARRVDDGLPRLGARRLPASRMRPGRMSRTAYEAAVGALRQAIAAGRLEKAVLARDVIVEPEAPVDLGTLLEALARAQPDAAIYCVDGLIGASPETLVTVHDGVVTARVLAGTAGPGEAHALAASDKDRAEHEFAARSVIDALAPHVARLTATEPYVLELPHLTHLATDLRGAVADGSDVLALVAALHPTAAVAGTPVDAALAAIRESEPIDRGRYAGPVGWLDERGDGEWAIALRGAQLLPDGRFRAFAGAGIVADSVPELELAETDLKLRPILEALRAVV